VAGFPTGSTIQEEEAQIALDYDFLWPNPGLTSEESIPNLSAHDWHLCTSKPAGRRSSLRRRWGLSKVERDFDKNPRLETVVGFFVNLDHRPNL